MGACSFCSVEVCVYSGFVVRVCWVKDAKMCVSRAIAPRRDNEGMTVVAVVVGTNGYAKLSKRAGQSHEQSSRDARCERVKVPNRLGREERARLLILGADEGDRICLCRCMSSVWKQTEESYVEREEKRSRTGRGRSRLERGGVGRWDK